MLLGVFNPSIAQILLSQQRVTFKRHCVLSGLVREFPGSHTGTKIFSIRNSIIHSARPVMGVSLLALFLTSQRYIRIKTWCQENSRCRHNSWFLKMPPRNPESRFHASVEENVRSSVTRAPSSIYISGRRVRVSKTACRALLTFEF